MQYTIACNAHKLPSLVNIHCDILASSQFQNSLLDGGRTHTHKYTNTHTTKKSEKAVRITNKQESKNQAQNIYP